MVGRFGWLRCGPSSGPPPTACWPASPNCAGPQPLPQAGRLLAEGFRYCLQTVRLGPAAVRVALNPIGNGPVHLSLSAHQLRSFPLMDAQLVEWLTEHPTTPFLQLDDRHLVAHGVELSRVIESEQSGSCVEIAEASGRARQSSRRRRAASSTPPATKNGLRAITNAVWATSSRWTPRIVRSGIMITKCRDGSADATGSLPNHPRLVGADRVGHRVRPNFCLGALGAGWPTEGVDGQLVVRSAMTPSSGHLAIQQQCAGRR